MESAAAGITEVPSVTAAKAKATLNLVMFAPFGLIAVGLFYRGWTEWMALAGRGELPLDPLGIGGKALRKPARHLADIDFLLALFETVENFLCRICRAHFRNREHRRHAGVDRARQGGRNAH